jgi:hypothetical protein
MARDGAGDFTLPLPDVIAGEDILASWANTTMTDVETELTDSLSRTGKGGMSAALKLSSGTISAPGVSFTSEANSGLYRSSAGDIRFAVGGADYWRVTSAGFQQYVSASWTSPVVLAGAQTITGAKTFDASPIIGVAGQGIDFAIQTATAATGATTSSELLDHYEEGTWTPNLWDDSLSSAEGQTYGQQSGVFTRIGNRVFIDGLFVITSAGTLNTAQNVRIGPLPFTSAATYITGNIVIGLGNGLHFTDAGTNASGYVNPATNYITLTKWSTTGGTESFLVSDIGNSGALYVSGCYIV